MTPKEHIPFISDDAQVMRAYTAAREAVRAKFLKDEQRMLESAETKRIRDETKRWGRADPHWREAMYDQAMQPIEAALRQGNIKALWDRLPVTAAESTLMPLQILTREGCAEAMCAMGYRDLITKHRNFMKSMAPQAPQEEPRQPLPPPPEKPWRFGVRLSQLFPGSRSV